MAVALIVVSMAIAYYSAPRRGAGAQHGATWASPYEPRRAAVETRETPGEWLEYSPLLTVLVCALGLRLSRARSVQRGTRRSCSI